MIDDVLWETINIVLVPCIFLRAFLKAASVAKSRADALSSNMSISGFLTTALAIKSLLLSS